MILKTLLLGVVGLAQAVTSVPTLAQQVDFDPAIHDDDPDFQKKVTGAAEPAKASVLNADEIQLKDGSLPINSCVVDLDNYIFNFKGLQLQGDEYMVHTMGTKEIPHNYTLFFNICEYTQHRCSDAKTMDYANSVNNNQTCNHLSGSDNVEARTKLLNKDFPEYGVNMKMIHGNQCNATHNYELDIQINCDAGATKTTYKLDLDSIKSDECTPKVIMNSPYGCPVYGMPPLWNWIDANLWVVSAFLILFGASLLQFGGKHYFASMAMISTFGMGSIMVSLLFGFIMPSSTPHWMIWICIALCYGAGAGLGYGAYNWPKVGVFTIGSTVGAFIGSIIYIIFFSDIASPGSMKTLKGSSPPIDTLSEEIQQLWICILSSAAIFGFIGLVFFDYTVIYGSCIIGSYLVVRGVSLVLGGYPNEFLIYDSLLNHKVSEQQNMMFIYLIAFLLISIFMIQYQLKMRLLNIELYSYKKYDFRYRKPSQHGAQDVERPRYDIIPDAQSNADDVEDILREDRA